MNNQKVIKYQLNFENENDIGSKQSSITEKKNAKVNKKKGKKINWKIIVFPLIGLVLITALIVIIIKAIPRDSQITNEEKTDESTEIIIPDIGPIEMQTEYCINTNLNDLKRIFINQKCVEEIKIDGILSKNIVDRKTNYDIYIISETSSNEKTKNFYNKTYTCSISISSECISSKDEYCIPQKLVDLIDQDYSNERILEEEEENGLENFPMPLCIFNLTDNNVITSIACHKNISENKINSIVLDLYFFRPPGIKRMRKQEGNITVITKKEGDKEIVRETNGGICDVENSLSSFCTTDMITTKDLKGNLLRYDEEAFTNITTNEDNYYIKNKTTQLIDKTEFILNFNPIKYNETLNILYPKLEKYLKYYKQFSIENFQELYISSKNLSNHPEYKKKRNLIEESNKLTLETKEELFNYSHYSGMEIYLNFQVNSGYNSEAQKVSTFLEIDGEKFDLGNIKEFSDFNKTINKLILLSKAGNNLATNLYKRIKENMHNITEIVRIKIPLINNMISYKELTDIFDSTYSLNGIKVAPFEIIQESNKLINKLDEIYNGINSGNLKNNISILNDYIYKFIKESHILVNSISNNLNELGGLINTPKETITFISLYYMNHTSTSFTDAILEGQKILMNYYENEKELIISEVNKTLEDFEKNAIDSIQKQINLVNKLYERLKNLNLTIKDAKVDDYNLITTNLINSNNYLNRIITLFKTKVKNEMNLKDGYFINKNDIESNNQTFFTIIENALSIAKSLDNNEHIDKTFDEIMTKFRNNFTSITKYMETIKEEQFPMAENTLNGGYFKPHEQETISEDLKKEGRMITNKINEENNSYLNKVNKTIEEFLKANLENLNNIFYELESLFSETRLEKMDNIYNKAFNGYLSYITNDINNNKELSYIYLDGLVEAMKDNNKIIQILQNTPVNKALPPGLECKYSTHAHCWKYTRFVDLISAKYKTQLYLNKYNIIKAKFDSSKDFINVDLHTNILQEYKKMTNNIKEILQTFKGNKMSDKYPELTDLEFIDEHIGKLNNFYNNLNKYLSDDKFNQYYLPKIDEYKYNKINEIDNIEQYIEGRHEIINPGKTSNSIDKDFCASYIRKKTYTCNNGAVYEYNDSGEICFEAFNSNNYKNLVLPSFKADENLKKEFEDYISSIREKIENYNNKIKKLKDDLISIDNTVLNENITFDYLKSIREKTNSILFQKFSDNLIQGSYNYFKGLLDKRLENVLNNVSSKWIDSFDKLENNINNNLNKFKSSIQEFGLIAIIYKSVICQNLTKGYYDSIITHQKSEFNYTISYYYNILLQNITSVYQSIFNQIPTNQKGLNNILDLRKKEIKDEFDEIIELIMKSKEKSLSLVNQKYVLGTSITNFFQVDSIFSKINSKMTENLESKGNTILGMNNVINKRNDQFSLACKFYLENSLNGLQIEDYYQPINENIFVELKLEKFKEILSSNWIFDKEDFINQLNYSLYLLNLELFNDFSIEKEKYKDILDKEISNEYSRDKIVEKINNQYNLYIKEINDDMANQIKTIIIQILEEIKTKLTNEENRLKKEAVSFSKDNSKFKKTIQDLKMDIVSKLKEILYNIVNDFTEKMYSKAYNRFENCLNQYLEKAVNFSETCETIETFNSSFNLGNIAYDIINKLVIDYKNFTNLQIKLKNESYIEKKENEAKMQEIKTLIDDELEPKISSLLTVLNDIGIDNIGNKAYDLSDEIKQEFNSKIIENMNEIDKIVQTIKGAENKDILYDWPLISFERVDALENIRDKDFAKFIHDKILNENNQINQFLKDIIRNNFNTLINNLILSFGNEFFERVIHYNENFKISTLYQDLKYSLVISLLYYGNLYAYKNIDSLTQDLKIKLYNLNNLDLIAKEKNKKVLNLLNNNIVKFIQESRDHILGDYKLFLLNDALIKKNFNNKTLEKIKNSFIESTLQLNNDFNELLNEEFKNKFINSYTEVMNKETDDMIKTINTLKLEIKSMIDDLFSLDIDIILNKTNSKMNETLDSIKAYTNHFESFKIPEKLLYFIDTYGDNVIQRSYDGLETLINKETKNITLTLLNTTSQNFKNNLNADEFLQIKNNIYTSLKDDNIDVIKKEINSYGINDFRNTLDDEMNRINSRRLRRLTGEETEADISEDYKEKVSENTLEDRFDEILNISENTMMFVETNENFDKFRDIIQKNLKKLNISFKESQLIIDNAYKDDDMYKILNGKLNELKDYSLNYYEKLQDNFNSLVKFLEESVKEIDNLLNQCANSTYETIGNILEEISNEAESIDKEYDKETEVNPIKKTINYQNGEINTEAKISSMRNRAKFEFKLISETKGKLKKKKIINSVVNQIKPDRVDFKISSPYGTCGEIYHKIEVYFNNASYSKNLNFDTISNILNGTTITDFESYKYTIGKYEIENAEGKVCICILNICTCTQKNCDPNNPITLDEPLDKIVDPKYNKDYFEIKG